MFCYVLLIYTGSIITYNTSESDDYVACMFYNNTIIWLCCSTGHHSNVVNSARIIGKLFQNSKYMHPFGIITWYIIVGE